MGSQAELDPKINEAISAALENDWDTAIDLNRNLIEKYPEDIDTMNRLARALTETGGLVEAKKIYKKILSSDPYNKIAEKNLNRLSSIKKGPDSENKPTTSVKGDFFLEEPGKTIVLPLGDTAMPQVLADLQIGDNVRLEPHKNEVTVTSSVGRRIGKIQSESTKSLAQSIRAGSKFEAFIKSISIKGKAERTDDPQVFIFIRELKRSTKVTTSPFPISENTFTPFVRDETFIRSNQAPVLAETEDSVEEVEVNELSPRERSEESIEDLAAKEREESDTLEEE